MADTSYLPPTLQAARLKAQSLVGHARSCKKHLDACKLCQDAIAWYASLPPMLIADVLADQSKAHRS